MKKLIVFVLALVLVLNIVIGNYPLVIVLIGVISLVVRNIVLTPRDLVHFDEV